MLKIRRNPAPLTSTQITHAPANNSQKIKKIIQPFSNTRFSPDSRLAPAPRSRFRLRSHSDLVTLPHSPSHTPRGLGDKRGILLRTRLRRTATEAQPSAVGPAPVKPQVPARNLMIRGAIIHADLGVRYYPPSLPHSRPCPGPRVGEASIVL
jgi:hypothetical protein